MTPDVVRTPDHRFQGLPQFAYEPRYADWDGLRLARIDEGPADAPTVVLLHGEPTWSFLYRKLLPPLLGAGLRVVVPDLPGFGRSDKPTDQGWYTWRRMYDAVGAQIDASEITGPLTLVVHDWGGVAGLPWAVDHADRLAGLVIMDTGLYVPGTTPSEPWQAFRDFVERSEILPVGFLVQGGAASELPEEVVAAYEAPFAEEAAHAGALALPLRVPLTDDDEGAQEQWAANQALASFEVPTVVLWGEDDDILTSRIGRRWADTIPGCVGMETFTPAGHFLQEDQGEVLGERIAAFVGEHAH